MTTQPDHHVELTLSRSLAVWWAIVWRSFVFSMLTGAALGLVAGIVLAASGRTDLGAPIGALLGGLGSIPVSLFVVRKVLLMRFPGFTIKLVATAPV